MPSLVALAMPAGWRFVDELLTAWDDGDAVLPVDIRLPEAEQRRLAEAMGAARLVWDGGERALEGAFPTEDGDALVMATSGTTGAPKGAVLTHEAVAASARITSRALGIDDGHAWVQCLPVSHIGGLSVITRSLETDTPLMIVEGGFDPLAVEECARRGGTHVSLVATAMQRVDTSLFERILLGGGPKPDDAPDNAVATYGSTETGSGIVYDGLALDGVELRTDEAGRLFVKSPTLLRTYRDGSTPLTADGWLRTGDAASIDGGVLTVHGRFDDAIITGGEKVWPAPVEAALRAFPGIGEALVDGEADPEWGTRVVADIELEPGQTPPATEALREHLKAQLAAYAVPKTFRYVARLPRTGSGKVKRNKT